MIEEVKIEDQLYAIIIKNDYNKEGVQFFTPDSFSQQLAYMSHKSGHIIQPHVHTKVLREVHFTQEVLVIKKGKLRVDFYSEDREYLESRIISAGDIILLSSGGHGFEVVEDLEMVEIKQGPFVGGKDKIRFEGIKSKSIVLK